MAKPGHDGAEIRPFRDADEFDAWLAEHHGEPAGVWLKPAKASSGIPSMTSDEAVDVDAPAADAERAQDPRLHRVVQVVLARF